MLYCNQIQVLPCNYLNDKKTNKKSYLSFPKLERVDCKVYIEVELQFLCHRICISQALGKTALPQIKTFLSFSIVKCFHYFILNDKMNIRCINKKNINSVEKKNISSINKKNINSINKKNISSINKKLYQ